MLVLILCCIFHLSTHHTTTTTTTTNRSSTTTAGTAIRNLPGGTLHLPLHVAHGFVPTSHRPNRKKLINGYNGNVIIPFAKPPPTANFDLEAIEALEAELEYKEKLERMKNADQNTLQENMDSSQYKNEDDADEIWEYMTSNSQNVQLQSFQVSPTLHNHRLDAILSEMIPELSRSQCGSLISEGMVSLSTVQDQEYGREPTVTTRKSFKVGQGTMIQVKQVVETVPTEILAQNIPLDILYEDEHMIVLNKAAGMVVHPAVGNWDGTVVNALAYYLANESPFGSGEFISQDGKVKQPDATTTSRTGKVDSEGEAMVFRPGIVHRLDKGTTGILVVAKTKEALTLLSEAFANRQVKKTYVAVTGKFGNGNK
jgi:Pseudouridylate synthases, 23S RNA-specific